ncbi:MAG TPA: hypothetical protein VFT77_14995 [Reyranella sp.]|nr:hypothetical protein [Reyranella sp.]
MLLLPTCDRKACSKADVAGPSVEMGGPPDHTPPVGTNRRIRDRAIWAVALFAASVIPTLAGLADTSRTEDHVNVAYIFAFAFWSTGALMALAAAFLTLRYWEGLPEQTRWLGALPLLTVSLFLSGALIAVLLP